MSQVRTHSPYLAALDEDDGARIEPDSNGYCALTADTFFFPVGIAADAKVLSVQLQTDSAIAGTFSLERTDSARNDSATAVAPDGTVTDWDDSATSPWVKDDSAVNAFVSTNGTGWTPTVLTLVKTAGVGNAIWDLSGRGSRRYRVRADVTTPGGVRVSAHGKS